VKNEIEDDTVLYKQVTERLIHQPGTERQPSRTNERA
jgi:hypothetical protein